MTGVFYGIVLVLALLAAAVLSAGCTESPVTGSPVPTPLPGTDLTNQDSPQAAAFSAYPSRTSFGGPAVPVGLRLIAGGFAAPMMVTSPGDGSGRHFLADQSGLVQIFFMNGTVADTPFLDIRDRMAALSPGYDERGLYSFAFHPAYATNGRVFVYYSAPLRAGGPAGWSCTNRLSEFRVSLVDPDRIDVATEKVLLEVDKPAMNHNGGVLLFGPDDGFLYLTLGDGGGADDTGTGHTPGIGNAQDMTKLYGKVLRIDVDSTSPGKPYGIPADNPFRSAGSTLPEIYASGFRNPAFATVDAGSHRMFIADAGQRLFESVFVLYKGGAYPWNIREGTHCFDAGNNARPGSGACPSTAADGRRLIGPVAEIGHDAGNTIVGGVLYRGDGIPALTGSYIYGTWSDDSRGAGNGSLLVSTPPAGLDLMALPGDAATLTPALNAMWTTRPVTVADHENGRINAFVRGLSANDDHEILILTSRATGPSAQASGEIWLLVPSGSPGRAGTTVTTPPPAVTTPRATAVPAAAGGPEVSLTLTARNMAFDQTTLAVPAGARVVMTFVNAEAIPHNFALYTDSAALTALFVGEIVRGPSTVTYTFVAPSAPGAYFFRCDIHPATMTGTLVVT